MKKGTSFFYISLALLTITLFSCKLKMEEEDLYDKPGVNVTNKQITLIIPMVSKETKYINVYRKDKQNDKIINIGALYHPQALENDGKNYCYIDSLITKEHTYEYRVRYYIDGEYYYSEWSDSIYIENEYSAYDEDKVLKYKANGASLIYEPADYSLSFDGTIQAPDFPEYTTDNYKAMIIFQSSKYTQAFELPEDLSKPIALRSMLPADFLDTDIKEIRIFSRDEKKQDDMRHQYNDPKIKYYIGNVRDIQSVRDAMHGVDYIFHAAALKQVPSCEFFPMEAVRTNVLGTDNVLTAAIEAGVKKVICLSTDKAAYPVNAMGTSKAMMEKVFVAKSRTVDPDKTLICGTRYGNVMCSRGSVIPLFIEQIKEGRPLTVTEPKMTRFIMSLEEAVELVIFAFENAQAGDIMVQKAPACTIEVLAQAVKELFDADNEIKVIGIRHGEKMYETLLTNEECARAMDMGNFFRVPCDQRDLNYDKYFVEGDQERTKLTEFNSNNTEILNVDQVKEKLLSLEYVRDEIEMFREQIKC